MLQRCDGRADQQAEGARGWAVFPCRPCDKRPAVDKWEQRAIADPDRVAAHWPTGANIGVACGPSNLVVIDLDCHGELPADWRAIPGVVDGRDVFALLLEWAGKTFQATYFVATPSGGWHLYFEAPGSSDSIRNSAGMLGPGVDVRAHGGYVLGAGSVVDGRTYAVFDDRPPAPLPGWLRRRLMTRYDQPGQHEAVSGDSPANLRGLVQTVRDSQPGSRTDSLVWAAHRLREEIAAGRASRDDGILLVHAAVAAGIRGGEPYARYQVRHVLGGTR